MPDFLILWARFSLNILFYAFHLGRMSGPLRKCHLFIKFVIRTCRGGVGDYAAGWTAAVPLAVRPGGRSGSAAPAVAEAGGGGRWVSVRLPPLRTRHARDAGSRQRRDDQHANHLSMTHADRRSTAARRRSINRHRITSYHRETRRQRRSEHTEHERAQREHRAGNTHSGTGWGRRDSAPPVSPDRLGHSPTPFASN